MDVKIEITNVDEKCAKEWVTGGINSIVYTNPINDIAEQARETISEQNVDKTEKIEKYTLRLTIKQDVVISTAITTVLEIFTSVAIALGVREKQISEIKGAWNNLCGQFSSFSREVDISKHEYRLIIYCLLYCCNHAYTEIDKYLDFTKDDIKTTISYLTNWYKSEVKNGS